MEAKLIEFEFAFERQLRYASFHNTTFDVAYKSLIKQFKAAVIYSVVTEY